MKSLASHSGVALCILVSTFVACQKGTSTTNTTELTSAASSSTPKASPIPDAEIAQAIRRYLQEDHALVAAHVAVAVSQGIATVSGSVDSLLAKEHAARVAEMIRGVRSVIDEVVVSPIARTDEQLKSDVLKALQQDIATRPYAIVVAVTDGKVTLSGIADSWQEKDLVADVAKAVKGVRALDNTVAVKYSVPRPDAEIATDVKRRISNDVWLDGNVLGVTVSARTVHLSGIVGNVAQKLRANHDGRVAGVDAIDDRGVIVDWLAENDQRHTSDFTLKSDAEIATAVRDAFQLDPRLKTLEPQVTVVNGVVTLAGTVADSKARRAGEADAKNTVGVWRVRDEVIVQPEGKPADADINRAVKQVLSENFFLSDATLIHVSSTMGRVVLTGSVASAFERFDALDDIARVPGVVEIDNELVVKRSPADIKATIDDLLAWDPMVEHERVSVAVGPDGVATLTGTLDSWSEMKMASDDAVRGGATHVVNLLKLRNHPEVLAL